MQTPNSIISRHINIFTRYPKPGSTKTRLIPELGPLGAANLHVKMLKHIISQSLIFSQQYNYQISVWYEGCSSQEIIKLLGPNIHFIHQASGDLGDRMLHTFRASTPSIIIGSDSPHITAQILNNAFFALHSHDLVIGPAFDGGYYLIGMNQPYPSLFKNINWGTETVLSETLKAANVLKLKYSLLKRLPDIDRPSDLVYLDEIDI